MVYFVFPRKSKIWSFRDSIQEFYRIGPWVPESVKQSIVRLLTNNKPSSTLLSFLTALHELHHFQNLQLHIIPKATTQNRTFLYYLGIEHFKHRLHFIPTNTLTLILKYFGNHICFHIESQLEGHFEIENDIFWFLDSAVLMLTLKKTGTASIRTGSNRLPDI